MLVQLYRLTATCTTWPARTRLSPGDVVTRNLYFSCSPVLTLTLLHADHMVDPLFHHLSPFHILC